LPWRIFMAVAALITVLSTEQAVKILIWYMHTCMIYIGLFPHFIGLFHSTQSSFDMFVELASQIL